MKKDTRSAERENMMQMFYQMEINGDFSSDAYENYISSDISYEKESRYSKELYNEFAAHRADIDKEISDHTINWKITRIPAVDLSILRLSLTEIHYMKDIPVPVAINEAVVLAKKFSTEKSASFINGVLGKIVK